MKKRTVSILAFLLLVCILSHPKESVALASFGLTVWFQTIIPVLYPFLVLSGILIQSGGIHTILRILGPFFQTVFRCSAAGGYAILSGLLFGMPMGSKTIAALLEEDEISLSEASYLFRFCNQLSPNYMISFALPLLGIPCKWYVLAGFYGIPLFYGVLLRASIKTPFQTNRMKKHVPARSFAELLDTAVSDSTQTILALGGYMILFQVFTILLLPMPSLAAYLRPMLEISGGLSALPKGSSLFGVAACSFGGLCSMAQTYYSVKNTPLKTQFGGFLFHRICITLLVTAYFFFLFRFL